MKISGFSGSDILPGCDFITISQQLAVLKNNSFLPSAIISFTDVGELENP